MTEAPAVSPERRLLFKVALCTGLRVNELKKLRVMHLNPEDCCLILEDWTKNRKDGLHPVPRELMQSLLEYSEGKEPDEPLLQVSSHPARDLDKDLARAGIEKHIEGKGKLDFHALRVAHCTFLREAGADMKEAQTLARHSDPRLTMKIYMRTRDEGLSAVTESVGDIVLGADGPKDAPDPTAPNPFTVVDSSERPETESETSSKAAG